MVALAPALALDFLQWWLPVEMLLLRFDEELCTKGESWVVKMQRVLIRTVYHHELCSLSLDYTIRTSVK